VTESSVNDDNSVNGSRTAIQRRSDKLLGTLVLLTVPLSWGTYSPVVRYLYAIEPPVPGFVFSACYYIVAAATTLSLVALSNAHHRANETQQNQPFVESSKKQPSISIQGGVELGSYLFVANCLQVVGLQTVEAERAGFLVQLTTVMVPLAEALLAGNLAKVPIKMWIACVIAFLGLCIMGLDGKDNSVLLNYPREALSGAFTSLSQGDCLILAAAVLYTLHVVRLGTYANQTTPMRLASSKATTETVQSIGLIAVLVGYSTVSGGAQDSTNSLLGFAASTGQEISDFFISFSAGLTDGSISTAAMASAIGAVFWTGWVTCAYTIWAQSYGQARVSPTNANLIYTFQPIFTSLFAYILLGETMGPAGFIGGALIASAVYVVAEIMPDGLDTTTGSKPSSTGSNIFTTSTEPPDHTFYGISLSDNVWEAPALDILVLVIVVIAIIFQPKRFRRNRRMCLSFWVAIVAMAVAAPQTTLKPFLTTIIDTGTSYPYLVVIPHCIVSAATYRAKNGDKIPYLQSLVLSFFLYGFGGTIVSDILMGLPVTALSHPRIIPCYLLAWYMVWLCPRDFIYQSFNNKRSALGYVLKGLEAVDAVTTPLGRVSRSARELRNKATAPVVAGLLAGIGGGGVRYVAGEDSSSLAAMETAFWKTISYSTLWWWLVVYQCDNNEKTWFRFDREWNQCISYSGSDLLRIIVVCSHTIWVLLVDMRIFKGHPFVWICRTVFVEAGAKLGAMMRWGPIKEGETEKRRRSPRLRQSVRELPATRRNIYHSFANKDD
jgi:drug/metabolite transporter (DMT)-like permease